jgi:putative holliday junction resolvase
VTKLALDVGKARIGIARSEGSLSLPISVIANDAGAHETIRQLVLENSAACIYIGLPLSLSGSFTPSTQMAIAFGKSLQNLVEVPVRFIDERLTSKSASHQLRNAGKDSRGQKGIIDASAAAIILEFALNSERGELAGKSVEDLDA